MAPNVLESDSTESRNHFNNRYIDYDFNFMQSLIIKSKHLIIDSVSKASLNGRIGSLIDNFERKFSSNDEILEYLENENKDNKDVEKDNKKKRRNGLLKITEVPNYLRFNPWILSGYRSPKLSTIECLMSLSYFHNETINIMTHSIPLLYCLSIMSSMVWWQTIGSVVLSYCHCFGLMSWAFGSSTYHLFMNHKSGQKSYYRLLQCDMICIWITQSIGALPNVYASLASFPFWFQFSFIGLYAVFSIFSLREGVLANSAWKRPASFAFLFLMRIIALGLRIQSKTGNNTAIQVIHILMQESWPIIGAFISAARMPERYWPGVFDYALNSHNIMHCFVVFGAIHMHWAFNSDLQWLIDNNFQIS